MLPISRKKKSKQQIFNFNSNFFYFQLAVTLEDLGDLGDLLVIPSNTGTNETELAQPTIETITSPDLNGTSTSADSNETTTAETTSSDSNKSTDSDDIFTIIPMTDIDLQPGTAGTTFEINLPSSSWVSNSLYVYVSASESLFLQLVLTLTTICKSLAK